MPEEAVRVTLREAEPEALYEIAGWSEEALARCLTRIGFPCPDAAVATATTDAGRVLRLSSTVAWIMGESQLQIGAEIEATDGCAVDLSNSRVTIEIQGPSAPRLLRSVLAMDVDALLLGDAAWTGIHGVPVAVVRDSQEEFLLLAPRSFSQSLCELLQP